MNIETIPRVLIVEDQPETAELARRTLLRAGYAPHLSGSVDRAKRMLRNGGFAALVLDFHLPDGSAWDVVEIAHAATPRVPVVLVTAMGSESVAAEAIARGVTYYVRKSDTFREDLTGAVGRAISLARMQAALQHDSALLQLIADNANDIIMLLDAEETILYASGAAERILGYPPSDLLGKPLSALVNPEDAEAAELPSARMRHLMFCRTRDNRPVLLEPTFRPVGQPAAARTIGVLRDVTDQVRVEEQLNHQQRMETVGQLTAGIAHDFNNLLQAMMGSLELLIDEVGDRPEMRECAEGALRMGERGARLTHHLLAFARKQVLKPRALDLPDLIGDIVHTLRRTLGPQISIPIEIQSDMPQVYADPGQLEAAMLNLALNARDAMPKGGTLRIAVCEAGPVVLNPLEDPTQRPYVVLSVSDTGTGMTPETLAKACEPFFTTKGPKGSGLGLSMVHGFARQSGGDMRVLSRLGEGTRVEVWLPVAEQPVEDPPEPLLTIERGAGRVLLVDDEAEVLVTLGSFLRGTGFTVDTVGSGDEALSRLARGPEIDVLVTDYAMPGLDGPELVAQARQLRPDLPVLVVSGYAEAERLESRAPETRVMRKPFRRKALVQQVASLIERSPLTVEPARGGEAAGPATQVPALRPPPFR
ncbi:MAG: response regulator [Rhodospirillales bacterium]|nr:response regulator [Rhodospirillales bacterium]